MVDTSETAGGDRAAKRKLGKTDIEITPLGLGAWQFSEGKGGAIGTWDAVPPEETDAIVGASLAGGINWFDTAELYGFGRSERGLVQSTSHGGKTVFLHTAKT